MLLVFALLVTFAAERRQPPYILFALPFVSALLIRWLAKLRCDVLSIWKIVLAFVATFAIAAPIVILQLSINDSLLGIWLPVIGAVLLFWIFNTSRGTQPVAERQPATTPQLSASLNGSATTLPTHNNAPVKVVSREEFVELKQLEKELFSGPASQRMAVSAAGLRAAELHQSEEKILAAQRAAAKAWAPPPDTRLHEQSEQVREQWSKWAHDTFQGSASQTFAATAAALRAFELGLDQDEAIAAAREAAKAWELPITATLQQTSKSNSPEGRPETTQPGT
jgi:hypothetical protein